MTDTHYNLMDWSAIEAITYSEHDDPHSWLGPHKTDNGILYNAYIPNAKSIDLLLDRRSEPVKMEKIEDFHFSALVNLKQVRSYRLKITYEDGNEETVIDPYSFSSTVSNEDERRFLAGIHYEIYSVLGAHVRTINGVQGVSFAVWAPNCERVSVVGDFNNWDGRRHTMRKLRSAGIFEIFIPGLKEGLLYKFELKLRSGLTYLKADPYANFSEKRPGNASVIADLSKYDWKDSAWMEKRRKTDPRKEPMLIYEVHLGSWKKPSEEDGSFYNYRELAVMLGDYVKKLGYTHVELLPVMEHPYDGSWGYQVTGYYSPTARYGNPEDFMYFIDYMHKKGIGVILDWVPAHFPKDDFGLAGFDGTHLYEHKDKRLGEHPHWGTLVFDFGRPEVRNFLIASALFWVEKYHADGIRMDAVASMLYLDYGRNDGEWVANIYGGNENLEAVELLKHLSSIFHKRRDGAYLIAEESTAWPRVTDTPENDGLGFDFKWNMGWMNDFLGYMKQDPLFRKGVHGALTFSMMYAYSENFILVFSHDEVVHGKCSLINKMPGPLHDKFANLRAAYGFMMGHPGKKLLFMGQEFGQFHEWNEAVSLDFNLLSEPYNGKLQTYVKDLNHMYNKYPAFYELDYDPEGFKWISCLDADRSVVSFVRRAKDGTELTMVVNFTPVVYDDFALGVTKPGKYKEIFNSDKECYGGFGHTNPRVKHSKKITADGWDDSINIVLPPLGFAVFAYSEK